MKPLIPSELGEFIDQVGDAALLFDHGEIEIRDLVAKEHAVDDRPIRVADTPMGWIESHAPDRWLVTTKGFALILQELDLTGSRPVVGADEARRILRISRTSLDDFVRRLPPEDRPTNAGTMKSRRLWWRSEDALFDWFEAAGKTPAKSVRARGRKRPRRGGKEAAGPVDFAEAAKAITKKPR